MRKPMTNEKVLQKIFINPIIRGMISCQEILENQVLQDFLLFSRHLDAETLRLYKVLSGK